MTSHPRNPHKRARNKKKDTCLTLRPNKDRLVSSQVSYSILVPSTSPQPTCIYHLTADHLHTKAGHLFLPINLPNGKLNLALIDTGSTINLMDNQLLSSFAHQALPLQHITIHGLAGTVSTDKWHLVALPLSPDITIYIVVATGHFPDTPLLLGMPFLTQTEALIDAPNKKIVTKHGILEVWDTYPEKMEENYQARVLLIDTQFVKQLLTNLEVSGHQDVIKSLADSMLTPQGQSQVIQILTKYQKTWTGKGVGAAKGVSHTIITTHNRPITLRPRHFPIHHQQELDRQINEMIEDKVITPSASPYKTYPVLVPKKDGGWRMAIDYRALNSVTVADKMPLPNIDDLIQLVEGSSLFALIDLRAGFWQIPMDPASIHKTAFSTHAGHYEFLVMPFGLINAPATFQRWTSDVFQEHHYNGMLVYLDDLLVHAPDESTFLLRLDLAFRTLNKYGAQVKLPKCHFAPKITHYLGHVIQQGVRRPDVTKLEPLMRIRPPKTVTEVRSLLGKLSYYRSYIPNFSARTIPLTRLLRKGAKLHWTPELQQIVKEITTEMTQAMLRIGVKGSRFRLEVDASQKALGAVLYDEEEYQRSGRSTPPVLCLSKTLNETEERWGTPEKEAYSLVWALEQSDQFVRGREVIIYTDHLNLSWIQNFKAGKIARWCSRLSEYQVTIKHQSGAKNDMADFLSRMIQPDPLEKETMSCYLIRDSELNIADHGKYNRPPTIITIYTLLTPDSPTLAEPQVSDLDAAITTVPKLLELQQEEQRLTPYPNRIIHPAELNIIHPDLNEILRAQREEAPSHLTRGFRYQGPYLYYLTGLWIPPTLRHRILDSTHLSLPHWHPGARKMTNLIRRGFCWEGMNREIQEYLKTCITCQRVKPQPPQLPLREKTHPDAAPFQHVYLDLWGPVNWNNDDEEPKYWLLTMVDNLTKWAEAEIITDKKSTTLATTFFRTWVARFGAPKVLTTDNEAGLHADFFKQLTKMFGIRHHYTTPYHPQGGAIVESFHRSLKKTLQKIGTLSVSQLTFPEAVAWALLSYRSVPHDTITESPAYLTYGADPITDHANDLTHIKRRRENNRLQILGELRQELQRKQQLIATQAWIKKEEEGAPRRLFNIGDWVLREIPRFDQGATDDLPRSAKLQPLWSHPYRVTTRSNDGYSALLACPLSGRSIKVYIDQVRFLELPKTKGQKELWRHLLAQEPSGTKQKPLKGRPEKGNKKMRQ